VRAPDASLFVITGRSVRYRLPGARGNVDVRTAGALGAVLRDLVAFVAGPLADVRTRYRLELRQADPPIVVATPTSRDVARSVRSLTLKFSRDLRVLESVVIEEPGGDRSDIRFRNVRINPTVPDSTFSLPE
jgi:outer membrane lipoprotein-sorting protein